VCRHHNEIDLLGLSELHDFRCRITLRELTAHGQALKFITTERFQLSPDLMHMPGSWRPVGILDIEQHEPRVKWRRERLGISNNSCGTIGKVYRQKNLSQISHGQPPTSSHQRNYALLKPSKNTALTAASAIR
jgi:hypothetical protein